MDLEEIARQTEGFSGRDLVEKVLKVALHHALMDECNITHKAPRRDNSCGEKELPPAPRDVL